MIKKISKKNKQLLLAIVLYALSIIIATWQNLNYAELIVYYALMAIVTFSWVSYSTKELKTLVFGFCTFLSVIVSVKIFESNAIAVAIMSIITQCAFYIYTDLFKVKK